MLLLFALQSALPPEMGPAWGEFTRRPALRRNFDKVEVGTLGVEDRSSGTLRYWLRHTREVNDTVTVRWADSRTCPQAATVFEAMRTLTPPTFAPPGIGPRKDIMITLDGVGYYLRVPTESDGRPGEITMRSNVNTPLARWVDSSLKQLDGCWGGTQPRRDP